MLPIIDLQKVGQSELSIPGSFFDAFPVTMIPDGSAIEPSYGAVHGKCKY